MLGTVALLAQYFLLLPVFALLAKRGERREPHGFARSRTDPPLESQY